MRKLFFGYYDPSEEELRHHWDNSIFSFDTNVLLNLYTYSKETSDAILDVLQKNIDRLWIPYQVAMEYHKNRCGRIEKEVSKYEPVKKQLNAIKDSLSTKKQHPFIDSQLLDDFTNVVEKIKEKLREGKETHKSLINCDPICEKITEIFDGKVGERPLEEELDKIYSEGAKRFKKKIPPGYMDKEDKPEPFCYGDLVLWKQLLSYSKDNQQSVIFVTDENKEDWWLKHDGKTLGPRPELLSEFKEVTGNSIYIYSTELFVKYANEHNQRIDEQVLRELHEAAEQRKLDQAMKANELANKYLEFGNQVSVNEAIAKAAKRLYGLNDQVSISEAVARAAYDLYGVNHLVSLDKALTEASKKLYGLDYSSTLKQLGLSPMKKPNRDSESDDLGRQDE